MINVVSWVMRSREEAQRKKHTDRVYLSITTLCYVINVQHMASGEDTLLAFQPEKMRSASSW